MGRVTRALSQAGETIECEIFQCGFNSHTHYPPESGEITLLTAVDSGASYILGVNHPLTTVRDRPDQKTEGRNELLLFTTWY